MSITLYPSVRTLADLYDAFIVDLWGVIHDGRMLYPGVISCLEELRTQRKAIIFLSNAPRRASRAEEVLERLGIPRTLYDTIITSGEVVFEYVQSTSHHLGKYFFIIGPDSDDGLLDGLPDYIRVKHPTDADFVIVTGFDRDDSVLKEVLPDIEMSLVHRLPLICANPDMEVVRQNGTRALCAGVIAYHYKKLGGEVLFFGKPYPDVYQKCRDYLAAKSESMKIAAIGDNLETDIGGANHQKIDSYLVTGGVLSAELEITPGHMPPLGKLGKICKKAGITPTGALPAFIW